MDFFERQDQARRHTGRLITYFGAAVVTIVVSVYLVIAALLLRPRGDALENLGWLWNPEWLLWVALGTLAVIALGSLFKIWELSRGGAVVATSLGGRLVPAQTTDSDERKLLNVVEEMAIASGVPVPDVYLLDHEPGINAFAAGFKPGDAVIGVTRGCARLLTRDELQGVIAHEFSHILNGDMRLNLRLIGWLNGILCLAILGYYVLRVTAFSGGGRSSGDKKGGNPLPLIGFALLIIGGTGVFFGRLIKSAVSRQREFLADASAVQFTRNPDGLVGALKKIGGRVAGSRILSPAAEEASHLFFGNGLKPSFFGGLFATHPPLEARIRVLDPSFDGNFPPVVVPAPEPAPATGASARKPGRGLAPPLMAGLAPTTPPAPAAPGDGTPAGRALDHAGTPRLEHLHLAGAILRELPAALRQAAQEPFAATALVYGGLIGRPGQQDSEAALGRLPAPVAAETRRLLPELRRLAPAARLPLFELCLPALRQLSPRQFDEFEATIRALIEADAEIDLFEYAALKMVGRHLAPHFRKPARRTAQYYALKPLQGDCAVLLAGLAALGADEPEAVRTAYEAGLTALKIDPAKHPLAAGAKANLPAIDQALDRLVRVAAPLRRQVLEACAATVAHDGRLVGREAELLRAIADTLECPLPPFVETVLA